MSCILSSHLTAKNQVSIFTESVLVYLFLFFLIISCWQFPCLSFAQRTEINFSSSVQSLVSGFHYTVCLSSFLWRRKNSSNDVSSFGVGNGFSLIRLFFQTSGGLVFSSVEKGKGKRFKVGNPSVKSFI